MSKENGFLPLRRGLWEHVRDGRMSIAEALAFIYICSQADTRTGIWKGSAGALAGEMGFKPRTARDVLERMEHGDYIRRFAVPGRHICYPILIHKFPITQGEHNGEHLNAIESSSPVNLAYFPCERDGEGSVEDGASQRRSKNLRKEKKAKPRAAKAPAPADPRHKPFVGFAYKSFEAKHRGQKPNWSGKDFDNLKDLLRNNQTLSAEELERRWSHYTRSTKPFISEQGDSLAFFCTNFDKFADGPILAAPQKGTNGSKPTIGENFRVTLAAMHQSKLPA